MSESKNLEARIEDLSINLHETMLATDINDSQYLEKTIGLILTYVKDILHFNCAEFFLFKNLDGSIPKKGEIGIDPRKKKDMRLYWITGVGYDEAYMKVATTVVSLDINNMPRGPPLSLFNPQFDFQPLVWYNNEEDMKKLFKGKSYKENYKILSREVRKLNENIPPLINAYMNLS
ncbi:MAG: hypothetical protein NTZ02_00470, partial [Candidatus Woesearchaeota archaeon]|nr:hypothetical protein [Candidatus Woesearchaeota archaeon]